MELLRNRRYKADEITISYLHEIKTQIESLIEVCQEGEVSVHDAENILHEELLCCMDYQGEIWRKLDNLEADAENDYTVSPEGFKILGFKASYIDFDRKNLEETLDKVREYNFFIVDVQDKLCEILGNTDYHKNRKAKIKLQINGDGVTIIPESTDTVQKPKLNVVDCQISHLVTLFHDFAYDYKLLIEKGFIVITEKGLRRGQGISKKFLTDYFKSVKRPKNKDMPWSIIESIFGETALKQTANHSARKNRECSTDFDRWVEIKNNLVSN